MINNNNFNILVYYKNAKLPIIYGLICGGISSYIISYIPIIYSHIVKLLLNENNIKENNINLLILSFLFYKFLGTFFAGLRGYIFTKYINLISINFIISPEQVLSKMKSYLTVLILFFQNIFSQSKKLKLMMFLNLLTSLKNGLKNFQKNY